MLHKCANSDCSSLFRRLTQGKLFRAETDSAHTSTTGHESDRRRNRPLRRVEYYWLCDACSQFLTLVFERGRGMITVPLPHAAAKKPVASALPVETLANHGVRFSNGPMDR